MVIIQKKLKDSEQQRQELQNEIAGLLDKLSELQKERSSNEEKDEQIKELQSNNNLLAAEMKELKVFLENYREYLRDKIQDANDTLGEGIFNETQQQEIEQEKQEYEAKVIQTEQFIGKINK